MTQLSLDLNIRVLDKPRLNCIIGEDGIIRNLNGDPVKTYIIEGYISVTRYKGLGLTDRFVHRIVAKHYIPNPDNLPEVNHINGIKSDNRVVNLEWCSHEHNLKHAAIIGLIAKGEFNGRSKLSKCDVIAIKKLLLVSDYNLTQIAKIFNVGISAISDINHLKTWKHITV